MSSINGYIRIHYSLIEESIIILSLCFSFILLAKRKISNQVFGITPKRCNTVPILVSLKGVHTCYVYVGSGKTMLYTICLPPVFNYTHEAQVMCFYFVFTVFTTVGFGKP